MDVFRAAPNPLHFEMILELVISKVEHWKDLLSCRLVNVRWNQFATSRINKEKSCNLVLSASNIDEYLEFLKSEECQGISRLNVLKLHIELPANPSADNNWATPMMIINVDTYTNHNKDYYLYSNTSMFAKAHQLIKHRPGNQQLEFISVKVVDPNCPSSSILVSKSFEKAMYRFLKLCSPTLRHVHLLFSVRPCTLTYQQHPTVLAFPELRTFSCNITGIGRFGPQGPLIISTAPNLHHLALLGNRDWMRGWNFLTGVGVMLNAMDPATLANISHLSICATREATLEILTRKQLPALSILKLYRFARRDHLFGAGPLAEFLRSTTSITSIQIGIYVENHIRNHHQPFFIPCLTPIPFVELPVLPNVKHFIITNGGEVRKEVDDQRLGFEHGRRILGNLVAARNAFPELESIELSALGCYQLARMFILSDRVLPISPEYLTRLDFQNVTTFHLTIPDSFCLARTQSSVSHLLGKFFPHVRRLFIGIEFKRSGPREWHAEGQKIVRFYLNHFQGISFLQITKYFQHFLAGIDKEEPNPIKDLKCLVLDLPAGLERKDILCSPPAEFYYKSRIVPGENGKMKKQTILAQKRKISGRRGRRRPCFISEVQCLRRSNPKLSIKITTSA